MVLVARDRGTPESLESRTNVLVDVEDVQVSQSLSIFKIRSSLHLLVSSNGKHNENTIFLFWPETFFYLQVKTLKRRPKLIHVTYDVRVTNGYNW